LGDVAVSLRRPEGMNECLELGNGKAGPNVWKWVWPEAVEHGHVPQTARLF
jgi:hypothetical protein